MDQIVNITEVEDYHPNSDGSSEKQAMVLVCVTMLHVHLG